MRLSRILMMTIIKEAPPVPTINGVYIVDVDGYYYNVKDWDVSNNSKAVGVAVIDSNCKFIIGKTRSNEGIVWTTIRTTIPGITTTTDESTAKKDYKGEYNSEIVRNLYPEETNAFNLAYSQTITVNGEIKRGYIGGLGEWQIAYNKKTTINNALNKIKGEAILEDYHWTSTQNSSSYAWILNWGYGDINADTKTASNSYVCPFYSI